MVGFGCILFCLIAFNLFLECWWSFSCYSFVHWLCTIGDWYLFVISLFSATVDCIMQVAAPFEEKIWLSNFGQSFYRLHFFFLSRLGIGGHLFLYLLEPWSCCFMVPLVWSLFNIWPPSIVDFSPSLHFFFFWISSLILDTLVFLVLCFYSWWISHVDKLPSWMVKRCCASILSDWELLMVKRCAFYGFVDVGFYRMVVKRCFVASSSKWLHLELWFPLVG